MGSDITYVELSGVTLGLYAGMEPQELALLVRMALHDSKGVCTGFQVTPETTSTLSSSRKPRVLSRSIPRLVPLSVACQAPTLLIGHVVALFTPCTTSQLARKLPNTVFTTEIAVKRLETLLQALEKDGNLTCFDAAMLRHLCAEQKAHVLAVMSSTWPVETKKCFLLQLLHPLTVTKQDAKKALFIEQVVKKVTTISTKVAHLPTQKQLVALADEIRHEWQTEAIDSRFLDTMELLTMTEKLLDKHMMPHEHGARLVELILGENKVLWRALQSYWNEESSVVDLRTIAMRLAALGCKLPKPIASKKSKGKSPRKGTKQGTFSTKKRVKNAPAVTAASAAVAVVISLHAQHLLTSLELDIIKALIEQEDFQVLETLRVYKQSDHGDVRALRDALVGIVEEITIELGDEEKATAGMDDAVQKGCQLKDSEDDSDYLEWQRHLSLLLGQWHTQQELTLADARALRKMVTQRHNLLESAYEVFAGDGDASELLDTLQRVAKLQRQIEQRQGGQIGMKGAPASRLSLEDVVHEMQRRGVLQGGDAAGLLVLFHGENEALQAANEAFLADGDVHELEDTLLLVVKHARFGRENESDQPVDEVQAICRLLADFGRSERLELWQIQLLISLLKSHDPRLLAAIDVYHEDPETNELADTLEILVDLAAWERHCRVMVHDWIPSLVQSGKLPRDRAERLVQMVKTRDDRIVAALVVFLSDNNKEEFLDTLVRIAFLEAMKVTDAEAGQPKEGHLVLAGLQELEDKGTISVDERDQVEELVCSVEPQMLTALDVLAATHVAENFAYTARRILAKVKEEVKDGVVGEKWKLEEVKPFSSLDVEPAANKEKSEENSDDDNLDAKAPEESRGDSPVEAEVHEARRPNELVEQQEIERSDELDQKKKQQRKGVEESREKDSVIGELESTKSDVNAKIKTVVDINDEMKDEDTGEQVEQEQQRQ